MLGISLNDQSNAIQLEIKRELGLSLRSHLKAVRFQANCPLPAKLGP